MSAAPTDGQTPPLWRVKKHSDRSIYGPVDTETLKSWADSSQIAPLDLIDTGDEKWRKATDLAFLEMLWLVDLPDTETYGPTTVGTLREFINEGLVTERTMATHVKTRQSLPIGALIAALEFEKLREAKRPPSRSNRKTTASLAVDMAKDQRIRQLEADLSALQKEHEALTHKFRQLTIELQEAGKLGRR